MAQALKGLAEVSHDTSLKAMVEDRNKQIMDFHTNIAASEKRGIQIGERKAAEKTAVKLLSKGLGINDICDITNISEEEIKALKNQ